MLLTRPRKAVAVARHCACGNGTRRRDEGMEVTLGRSHTCTHSESSRSPYEGRPLLSPVHGAFHGVVTRPAVDGSLYHTV